MISIFVLSSTIWGASVNRRKFFPHLNGTTYANWPFRLGVDKGLTAYPEKLPSMKPQKELSTYLMGELPKKVDKRLCNFFIDCVLSLSPKSSMIPSRGYRLRNNSKRCPGGGDEVSTTELHNFRIIYYNIIDYDHSYLLSL